MVYRLLSKLNDRMIDTCISILCLLPVSGLGVNQVIEQTSPDRDHVLKSLSLLDKAGCVRRDRFQRGRIRKAYLTELGDEIRLLKEDITRVKKCYAEFHNTFKDKIEDMIVPVSHLSKGFTEVGQVYEYDYPGSSYSKMRANGWTSEQIHLYNHWLSGGIFIDITMTGNTFLILLFRFLSLHRRSNQITDKILVKVMADELFYLLDAATVDLSRSEDMEDRYTEQMSKLWVPLFDDICSLYSSNYYLGSCSIVNHQLRSLVLSLFSLMNPSTKMIKPVVDRSQVLDFDNRMTLCEQKIPNERKLIDEDRRELKSIIKSLTTRKTNLKSIT